MPKKIIFIGGVHGAGKSTVAAEVSRELGIEHVKASEVIKWQDLSKDPHNKHVEDIDATQTILLDALKIYRTDEDCLLLDGHFCLIRTDGQIQRIPFQVFQSIDPIIVAVVTADEEDIFKRLILRGHIDLNLAFVKDFQEMEISYGREVAQLLGVDFIKICDGTLSEFISIVKRIQKPNESFT